MTTRMGSDSAIENQTSLDGRTRPTDRNRTIPRRIDKAIPTAWRTWDRVAAALIHSMTTNGMQITALAFGMGGYVALWRRAEDKRMLEHHFATECLST